MRHTDGGHPRRKVRRYAWGDVLGMPKGRISDEDVKIKLL